MFRERSVDELPRFAGAANEFLQQRSQSQVHALARPYRAGRWRVYRARKMLNHLKQDECAWGQEIAATIDMASSMTGLLAKQFRISEKCVSIKIGMDKFKEGTFH